MNKIFTDAAWKDYLFWFDNCHVFHKSLNIKGINMDVTNEKKIVFEFRMA